MHTDVTMKKNHVNQERSTGIMKKKNAVVSIIVLMNILLFSSNIYAKTANYAKLYRSFLTKTIYTIPDSEPLELFDCYFNILDINRDGVPELLIKRTNGKGTCLPGSFIFTIYKNRVVYSGSGSTNESNSPCVAYSRKYKAFVYQTIGHNSDGIRLYSLNKKGKFKEIAHSHKMIEWKKTAGKGFSSGKEVFYVGKSVKTAKKTSEKKFNKFNERYLSTATTIRLVPNNKANRKKILKRK